MLRSSKHWTPSLDVLLLICLVSAHVGYIEDTRQFFTVVPLLLYLWVALVSPLRDNLQLPDIVGSVRLSFLGRLLLVFIIIAVLVIVPIVQNIAFRANQSLPDSNGFSEANADIHDGAIQMEIALEYLKQGVNPYDATYAETPLRFYVMRGIDMPSNPALSYFVYLPGYLLISLPVLMLFDQLGLFYDQRLVYLAAYLLLVLILPALADNPVTKLSLLIAVGLNPLLTGPVVIGMNDVVVLAMLAFIALALTRRRLFLSTIIFGFACALKQSAWFIAPFYLLHLFSLLDLRLRYRQIVAHIATMMLIFLAIVLPFVLWNPVAFVTDVISYPAGTVPILYPIRGSTIGELLTSIGLIESRLSPFPFNVFQATFGLPALALLLRFQSQNNTLSRFFLVSGIFVLSLGFFSRFFQTNYVGFVLCLISLGMILTMSQGPIRKNSRIDSLHTPV